MGLDPRSPGSLPRLQAALNRCATGAAQLNIIIKIIIMIILESAFKSLQMNPAGIMIVIALNL